MELAGNIGSFTISNSTFTNCTSGNRGGAVAIRSIDIKNSSDVERWTRSNAITFSGCTFTNCVATGMLSADRKSISGGNGGSIEFADGCYITESATISGATIDGSKSQGEGYAIFGPPAMSSR